MPHTPVTPTRLRLVQPGHRNSQGGTVRRDKRGRPIGRNWWREHIVSVLHDAEDAWLAHYGTNHQMEPDEFRRAHPRPTLKTFLIEQAGMHVEPAA